MTINLSDEDFWRKIYDGFNSENCKSCCKQVLSFRDMSKPQPMPYIGPHFYETEHRLMFVGIETYCNWPPRKDCNTTGYSEFGTAQVRRLFFRSSPEISGINYSPFWQWVNIVSTEILSDKRKPEEAFPRIAYSNLHKCQSRKKGSTLEDFCSSSYQTSMVLSRKWHSKSRLDISRD